MAITKLFINNFKSFYNQTIHLGNFNVLIGANAAGKSNFISVFSFLRDIYQYGLEDAISIQGGTNYLRNINIGSAQNLIMKFKIRDKYNWGRYRIGRGFYLLIDTEEIIYHFEIGFKKRGLGYEICKDEITLKCMFSKLRRKDQKIDKAEKLGEGEIVFTNVRGKIEVKMPETLNKYEINKENLFPRLFAGEKLSKKRLLMESPYILFPFRMIFPGVSIYDFDPKLPKKSSPIAGKINLEEDGKNLAIVIKNILQDKNKQRKFYNYVNYLLPFIGELEVEKFTDKSLLIKLKEKYFKKAYLPASIISDGTINVISLILALYFDKKAISVIEEPERNIHPLLISKIVEMMRDASKSKQIIVTTHNPEILRYAGIESILLISRNNEGYSSIVNPGSSEQIKKFLDQEIGIQDLFIQGLL